MRILLADDHQLFLEGMQSVLSGIEPDSEIECCRNGRDALRQLLDHAFDIALIDLRLPNLDGFGILTELSAANCLTPVIIVTASEAPHDARRCINLGAMGFVPKSSTGQQMIETIQRVVKGDIVKPQADEYARMGMLSSNDWASQHNITPRQFEVLRLIKQGHSNPTIADILHLSTATVKTHIVALFRALEAGNRTEAIQKAQQLGLD